MSTCSCSVLLFSIIPTGFKFTELHTLALATRSSALLESFISHLGVSIEWLWCVTEAFSTILTVHCEGWWLLGGRSSLVEHWWLKPGTWVQFLVIAITEFSCILFLNPYAGGVSLARSGLVPIGRGFPTRKPPSRSPGEVDMGEVNLHLVPTNQNITDTYGTHCASPSERIGERGERGSERG